MTLQPSTANFSLINYSQEKDLNNLFATRKHQKNPENIYFLDPLAEWPLPDQKLKDKLNLT